MNNKIVLNNVTFGYNDRPLFEKFSLTIPKGEHIAIVGANGSGKTTLARLISATYLPEKGSISVDGISFSKEKQEDIALIRRKLSVVLQNPEDQFVGTSVQEDIAFGLENQQVPREKMKDIIDRVSKQTGISELLPKEPHQLSGGQKQRVAIASSLALHTDYIIFDEATSQLDPQSKKAVTKVMYELQQAEQKTLIIITHDLDEILEAQRVIVMSEGAIVADTTPIALFGSDFPFETYHLQQPRVIEYSKALRAANLIDQIHFNMEALVKDLCK